MTYHRPQSPHGARAQFAALFTTPANAPGCKPPAARGPKLFRARPRPARPINTGGTARG
jgi:hypothetical protein